MITLLHGDDVEASRNELNRIKEKSKGKEIRQFDGRTLADANLVQALESNSMFAGEVTVIIENLFAKLGKQQKRVTFLCEIIKQSQSSVILWENKEVGALVVKGLGKVDVRAFKRPVVLFQFLDALKPANTTSLLTLYQKTVDTQAPELVFTMIALRLRQLIQIESGVEPAGLQGWQVSRLTSQARSFTITRLIELYKTLLHMDYSIKTGSSPLTMNELLTKYILDL